MSEAERQAQEADVDLLVIGFLGSKGLRVRPIHDSFVVSFDNGDKEVSRADLYRLAEDLKLLDTLKEV